MENPGPQVPRGPGRGLDRWTLYERCVQSPSDAVELLRRAHGGAPNALLEDFAGSAAISREWARRGGRALALDSDAGALRRAGESVEVLLADVRDVSALGERRFDVVHAGNFSLGYLDTRCELLDYFAGRRRLLEPRGILACDTYGGRSAFELGAWNRERFLDSGLRVVSTWEHRAADPTTARVENALHFRVERDGELVERHPDAFVYRWRLWSVPELREALAEAGFASSAVFASAAGPLREPAELEPDFSVCVVAHA